MGIEKSKLLACDSVFWSSINTVTKAYVKHCATCLEFQQTQPKEKITHHDIPLRLWEVVSADVFHLKNKHYLCIVDYNSKFPVIKRLEGRSADNLINVVKIIFTKYGIPRNIMSDVGTNFIADRFWQFCKLIYIEQAISSEYHHQSNEQVKACIKFIKCTFKKCTDPGRNINMALLQIHMMLLSQGLPSPATLMFSRPICSIMPVMDCKPLIKDCDDDHHTKLVERQQKNTNDASAIFLCIPIGSAVEVQQEDSRPWTHGTIVGTGDLNHHDKSYMIQLTANGRCITHNRCHIKPTTVTADAYIQYHSTKQQNAREDPFTDILNNLTKKSSRICHHTDNKYSGTI